MNDSMLDADGYNRRVKVADMIRCDDTPADGRDIFRIVNFKAFPYPEKSRTTTHTNQYQHVPSRCLMPELRPT